MAISEQQARSGSDQALSDTLRAGRRFTLDEFLALPDESPHLEFDDGVVTQKVAPKPTHSTVQGFLTNQFNQVAGPRRLGMAFSELRFVTPDWAPIPDIAFYRRERIQLRGRRPPAEFFEAPDLAVEIVSPEQSVTTLIKKCLRYLALGTRVAIIVDPNPESVLVFRPGQPLLLLQGDDRIDLDDELPGFDLTVTGLFDSLLPEWLFQEAQDGDAVPESDPPG